VLKLALKKKWGKKNRAQRDTWKGWPNNKGERQDRSFGRSLGGIDTPKCGGGEKEKVAIKRSCAR